MKKPVKREKSSLEKHIQKRYLYLLFALPLLYFIVFKYGAMAWLSIAFFDYNAFLGFAGSKFVGTSISNSLSWIRISGTS